jgi:putative flippase GtrA
MPKDALEAGGRPASDLLRDLFARYRQLIIYFVIGASASLIDVLLFMFIYNAMHAPAIVAHSISVPTAVLFSFVVNTRHNFKTTDHVALRMISFAVVCLIGYAAGFGVIELCKQAGIGANIGKIASLPVVFVIQYVLNSRITFGPLFARLSR